MTRYALILVLTLSLGACMQVDPVPDWVLVCYDSGGGEGCPPQDASPGLRSDADVSQADEERGPEP